MSRVALVVNSASGASDPGAVDRVRAELNALGRVEVVAPRSEQTFDDELREASSAVDVVVVAGGDGTMSRAVNALGDRLADLELGLVPMGTGNDLARTLALPSDPIEAARAVARGEPDEIDLARVSGSRVRRLFVNACVGGFPVQVNEAIDEDLKKRFGPAAFLIGGAKAATRLERATVTMNGVEIRDCVAVGVGNGRSCGGGLSLWPEAVVDDALLDGCALAASNHAAALELAARVKLGTHERMEEVATARAASLRITSEPPIELNVDGELVGLETPATFAVAGRLRIRR
jgi:diacylglycerol kinase (ATP)